MEFFYRHIRAVIFALSCTIALALFGMFGSWGALSDQQYVHIVDSYAFAAVIFLYLALLVSPLYANFPSFPLRPLMVRARRAFGVSAFFFAFLHAYLAFFKLLGGFAGLSFLNSRYLTGIALSATALLILSLLTATSLDAAVRALGRKWKPLHRLVYAAGVLVIIHALMLGSHFSTLSNAIPQVCLWLLVLLLLLEAMRFDKFYRNKFQVQTLFSPVFVINVIILVLLAGLFVLPHAGNIASLGVHARHVQLAQQAQTNPTKTAYTAVLQTQPDSTPGQPVQLSFTVQSLQTRVPVTKFDVVREKLIHLVIVNSELTYFSHIHPDLVDGVFTIRTVFPRADVYHLYITFQPAGETEQQIGFTVPVGTAAALPATQQPDSAMTKLFGDYAVTLALQDDLRAADLSRGLQTITFGISDAKTRQPITAIQSYLGAFGHLVMINEKTYQYVHIHPSAVAGSDADTAGPSVEFLPLGLSGPIEPGMYRLFAQFKIGGRLVVADFTVRVR